MGRQVRLDKHLCEGHALCVDIDPGAFTLSDNDIASCIDNPADEQWASIRAAVDTCPRGAISIVEA